MNKRRYRTQGKAKHLSNYKQFIKDKWSTLTMPYKAGIAVVILIAIVFIVT